jgi:hypothetical protein
MSDTSALEPTTAPVPAASPAPSRPTWTGAIHGIVNYTALGSRITSLAIAAALLKEQLHLLQARMRADAVRARRLAEQLAQAGVDARFQAQTLEAATAFERVADAAGELADAADGMEAGAHGVRDAHQTEYGAIYEIAQASPYAQPKPGFNAVH